MFIVLGDKKQLLDTIERQNQAAMKVINSQGLGTYRCAREKGVLFFKNIATGAVLIVKPGQRWYAELSNKITISKFEHEAN